MLGSTDDDDGDDDMASASFPSAVGPVALASRVADGTIIHLSRSVWSTLKDFV